MKIISSTKTASRILVILGGLTLAACSGGTGGNSSSSGSAVDGRSAGVNFSLQLEGARATSPTSKALATKAEDSGNDDSAESHDDVGTPITLTAVRVNIRDVRFHLPEGMICEEVQFTFVDPVRCDKDDESNEVEDESGDDSAKSIEDGENSGDDSTTGEAEAEDGSEAEDEVVVEGPFIADLINGTSTPSLTSFLIPSGNYQKIEVRIEEAKAEDGLLTAGDPLLGNSLVADGSFEYQGSTHDLHIRLKINEEIRFENPNGIPVEETGANDVVITLNEDLWFKGINLAACLDEGNLSLEADGSLVIDDQSGEGECGDVENIIKENVKTSGDVIKDDADDDDDGIEDSQDNDDDNDGVADDHEDDSATGPGDDNSGVI